MVLEGSEESPSRAAARCSGEPRIRAGRRRCGGKEVLSEEGVEGGCAA